MDALSILKPKSRLQQLKGWLSRPFKGWFKDKDVRVLSSHKGTSLEPTPGWQHRQHLRERQIAHTIQPSPFITPPIEEEEDELLTSIGLKEAALTELQALLQQQIFTMQIKAYREMNRNLLIVLQKLKSYSNQNNWQKVSEILRHHMPLLQINDFEPIRQEYEQINQMTDVLPPPPTPALVRYPLPMEPKPLRIINPDPPAAIPSAANQLTQLDNGQINLFVGDIISINRKVHPNIESLVCPHRADPQRPTPILDQLALLEPSLNDRVFTDRMQTLDAGSSMITAPGKIAGKGFGNIVHTIVPEKWDNQAHARLLNAYVSAIRQAHKQGSASIAIPVMSRYLSLTVENEVLLARRAIQYFLNNMDNTLGPPPRIYLVFPDNPDGITMRNQHLALNITRPMLNFNPGIREEHNRLLQLRLERVLDQVLPARGNMNISQRMQWLSRTVDNAIDQLERHEDLDGDGADLMHYIDNAKYALEQNLDHLSEDEIALAKKYLIDFEDRLFPYIHEDD